MGALASAAAAPPWGAMAGWLQTANVSAAVQFAALLTSRVLPMVVLTPIFGGQAVPARVRFGIAVVLGLALGCSQSGRMPTASPFAFVILLVAKELFVGALLALVVTLAFQAFAIFGSLVDQARGQGAITIHDPHANHEQTVLSVFGGQLAAAVFLSIGGHCALLTALADSFLALPVDRWTPPALHQRGLLIGVATATAQLLSLGLRLAAPAMIVALVIDLAGGLIARVAPQLDIGSHTMTLKGASVLFAVLCSLALVVTAAGVEPLAALAPMQTWLTEITRG